MSNSKRKSCAGKVRHSSLLAAQIALKRTLTDSRKGDPIVTGLSPYKCRYCGGWHVGRSQKKGIDWAAVERHSKVGRSASGGVKGPDHG